MKNVILFILAISILASCSTSNNVVSNKLFQKRKYQKGWYVNSSKTLKTQKVEEQPIAFSSTEENPKDTNQNTAKPFINEGFIEEKKTVLKVDLIKNKQQLTKKKNSKKNVAKTDVLISNIKSVDAIELDEPKEVESKQEIDREGDLNRILLALLGLFIIFFMGIAPLAILIAVGKGKSLTTSLIIYLLGIVMLAMAGVIAILIGAFFAASVFVPFFIGIAIIVIANIYAIRVIFRGY